MRRNASRLGLLLSASILASPSVGSCESGKGAAPGPFVNALRFVQRFGTAEAVEPRNDVRVKASIAKAIGKDGNLNMKGLGDLMSAESVSKFAGVDGRLSASEIARILDAETPESRARLFAEVRAHAELLATSFDMIDEAHRVASGPLVDWVVAHYRPGEPLGIVFVCTGNSRRSMLGSASGNIASAYYGFPEIRCFSGGTSPTAFNPRTIATLEEIGVRIEPNGMEAPRGEPNTANPIYAVRWGESTQMTEFSKHYADPVNPRKDFAALMVCSEADAGCPLVKGASARISMPYLDPKTYDGSPYESAKYAERRDDMGRMMMSVMMRARNRLAVEGKPGAIGETQAKP